jgi:hypothetical protein
MSRIRQRTRKSRQRVATLAKQVPRKKPVAKWVGRRAKMTIVSQDYGKDPVVIYEGPVSTWDINWDMDYVDATAFGMESQSHEYLPSIIKSFTLRGRM